MGYTRNSEIQRIRYDNMISNLVQKEKWLNRLGHLVNLLTKGT